MKKDKAPPFVVVFLFVFFAAGFTVGLLLPHVVVYPPPTSDCNAFSVVIPPADTSHNGIVIDQVSWNIAVQHIMASESFSADVYVENGRSFIGYGHMIRPNEQFSAPINQDVALQLLEDDFSSHLVPAASRYNLFGNQALAIGLMAYNRGVASTCSGCLDEFLSMYKINPLISQSPSWRNDIRSCWLSFVNFNGAPHRLLVARRNFEIDLFFSNLN